MGGPDHAGLDQPRRGAGPRRLPAAGAGAHERPRRGPERRVRLLPPVLLPPPVAGGPVRRDGVEVRLLDRLRRRPGREADRGGRGTRPGARGRRRGRRDRRRRRGRRLLGARATRRGRVAVRARQVRDLRRRQDRARDPPALCGRRHPRVLRGGGGGPRARTGRSRRQVRVRRRRPRDDARGARRRRPHLGGGRPDVPARRRSPRPALRAAARPRSVGDRRRGARPRRAPATPGGRRVRDRRAPRRDPAEPHPRRVPVPAPGRLRAARGPHRPVRRRVAPPADGGRAARPLHGGPAARGRRDVHHAPRRRGRPVPRDVPPRADRVPLAGGERRGQGQGLRRQRRVRTGHLDRVGPRGLPLPRDARRPGRRGRAAPVGTGARSARDRPGHVRRRGLLEPGVRGRLPRGAHRPARLARGGPSGDPRGGGRLPVREIGIGTASVPVRVVGRPSAFPGLYSKNPLLVVDEQLLLDRLDLPYNPLARIGSELWARGDTAGIQAAFAAMDSPPFIVLTAEAVQDIPHVAAAIDTFVIVNALGAVAALLAFVGHGDVPAGSSALPGRLLRALDAHGDEPRPTPAGARDRARRDDGRGVRRGGRPRASSPPGSRFRDSTPSRRSRRHRCSCSPSRSAWPPWWGRPRSCGSGPPSPTGGPAGSTSAR